MEILGIALAWLHAKLTFDVVRDVIVQRMDRRHSAGGQNSPGGRSAWQRQQSAATNVVAAAAGIAIADGGILTVLCIQGTLVTVATIFAAYLGLFFFAYAFHTFEHRGLTAPRPVSQPRELAALRRGEKTSVIESWRIRTWEMNAAELRTQVRQIRIDPASRILSVEVVTPLNGTAISKDRRAQYDFLHDVGELLIALTHERWMRPYREFFSGVELEIWGERTDEQGHPLPYRMLRLKGPANRIGEMRKHGWDVLRLDRMFDVSFKAGMEV